MDAQAQALAHGLAPCRCCTKPVAAPVGLLQREVFQLSRCPHCGVFNPHPRELDELAQTRRMAIIGGLLLGLAVAALVFGPMDIVLQRLPLPG